MDSKTPAQVAEDEARVAAHGHHGPDAECASCRRKITRALAARAWATAEKIIDLPVERIPESRIRSKWQDFVSALFSERDRLRREYEALVEGKEGKRAD